MRRNIIFGALLAMALPVVAMAQSTSFFWDVRGVDGLYSSSVDDPTDFAFIGGTLPAPGVEEESDVIACDYDSTGTLFAVDVFLNILGMLDPANGNFLEVAPLSGDIPPAVSGMTIDSSTDVAYVTDGVGLWTMDIVTGACTLVSAAFTDTATLAPVATVFELATDGAGNFWAYDVTTDALYDLDETNGDCTLLGMFTLGDSNFSNNGLDWDPVGSRLVASVYTGGGTGMYGTWDTTTGAFTPILDHGAYPDPATGAIGGPIACFGGTTTHVNFWLDAHHNYDTSDPTANFSANPQSSAPSFFGTDFDGSGTLHVLNTAGAGTIGTMDTSTGVFTPTASLTGDYDPFGGATGITHDPSQDIFYISSATTLYTLDVNTGATTLVGDFFAQPFNPPPPGTIIEIACNQAGDLFAFSITIDTLFEVDKTTGEVFEVGTFGGAGDAGFIQGMDFDPTTDILYGAIYTGGGTGEYGTWDTATGVFTSLATLEGLPNQDADGFELKLAIQAASSCAPPSSFQRFRGTDVGGPSALGDFAAVDGTAALYNPGFVLNDTEAPVWLIFDYAAPAGGSIEVTSNAGTPGLTMTAEYNDGSGLFSFVEFDTAPETFNAFTTEVFTLPASTDRVRIGWRQTGFVINFPWEVRVDSVGLCQ